MILVLLILLCAHCTEELSTPRVYLEEDDSSSPNLLCAHCTKELITHTVYLEEDDSSTPYSIVCTDELNTSQTVYLEKMVLVLLILLCVQRTRLKQLNGRRPSILSGVL